MKIKKLQYKWILGFISFGLSRGETVSIKTCSQLISCYQQKHWQSCLAGITVQAADNIASY